jgi:hypothetical protein
MKTPYKHEPAAVAAADLPCRAQSACQRTLNWATHVKQARPSVVMPVTKLTISATSLPPAPSATTARPDLLAIIFQFSGLQTTA